MTELSARKYKDELPIATINRIRNILGDLGILTIETDWKNSAEGFYSVTVRIADTELSVNGKGASSEYALASAYGELMERLQNQALFRLNFDFSSEALEYRGFFYAPDEKPMSIGDFLNSRDDWIVGQLSKLPPGIDKIWLLQQWKAVSYEEPPADFISLPYCNLKNGTLSYIPIKMALKMYMSNGMCAGNSPEEALVQGLSEVLERYVNIKIVAEKLTPPAIPREYLKKFPKIDRMITNIETCGNFKVIIKDCSLGRRLPVVGVIFVNQDEQTYFVKFGAHPIFEIAAERTLTELLQGQNVRQMRGVKEFLYKNDGQDTADNLIGILVNGSGYYPAELFSPDCSYQFEAYQDNSSLNNKQMLSLLLQIIHEQDYAVYVRDVSFLGFPSYHVIVPGLSEIEQFDDIKALTDYAEYNRIKRYIRNLAAASSDEEISEIAAFINKLKYGSGSTVTQLLNLSVKENAVPWYYSNLDLFLTVLYYCQGNYKNTYQAFNRFIESIPQEYHNQGMFTYYKCVRDFFGTRVDNLDQHQAVSILSSFYPTDMIHGVVAEFQDLRRVFRRNMLNCWNCDSCQLKNQCSYKAIERVYRIMKDQYSANPISQHDLKDRLRLE